MPDNGARTIDLTQLASAEDLLGHYGGSLGLVPLETLALLLAASGALADRLAELDRAASYASILRPTWTALAALAPTAIGQQAEVSPEDTGSHTDPQTSETVANAGRYTAFGTSAGQWTWVDGGGLGSKLSISARLSEFSGPFAAEVRGNIGAAGQAALDALAALVAEKAGLVSPALAGEPTAPTPPSGTNSTRIATTAFVKAVIDAMVDAAPGQLDTLNELAAALDDDPAFAATVTAALATKPTASGFETLDLDSPLIVLDDDGYNVNLPSGSGDLAADVAALTHELADTDDTVAALTTRVSRGLTSYGDPLGPSLNEWKLRNARRKLRLLQQGHPAQLVLNFFGDSWTEGPYFLPYLATALHDQYGIAGLGWVGFQSHSASVPETYTEGGTQPYPAGNARNDLVTDPVFHGTWGFENGGQGDDVATPSVGYAYSSTPGDYVWFSWSGAAHDSADLYYCGDGTGVVRYSWDGGATWSANLALATVGPAVVALAGVPTGTSGSLLIEVVSGNVQISGVPLKSTSDGVRVNALGASGSNTTQWAEVDTATWAGLVAGLGADFAAGMLATNDQSAGTPPATLAANVDTLLSALRTAAPTMDLLWIAPAENVRSSPPTVTMAQYSEAVRQLAVDRGWAFLDLQYAFGADPAEYDKDSPLKLLDGSNLHPSRPAGGMQITDAFMRLIAQAL
ncbi:SGNH/GDSL hydrolase family protein [Salipiger marinus]|uniref:SGNH/GDSL hydrolase family protein n=1 Tax=Salipiger marinus TaxID=555512 RepID=UPI00405990A2